MSGLPHVNLDLKTYHHPSQPHKHYTSHQPLPYPCLYVTFILQQVGVWGLVIQGESWKPYEWLHFTVQCTLRPLLIGFIRFNRQVYLRQSIPQLSIKIKTEKVHHSYAFIQNIIVKLFEIRFYLSRCDGVEIIEIFNIKKKIKVHRN